MTLFRKWDEAKSVEAVPGATRRTMAVGDRTLLVEWRIAQGAAVPLHTHEYEQIGYMASGSGTMTIGEQAQELKPGDGYCVPSGVPHGLVASEDCCVVDVFAPVREDYK